MSNTEQELARKIIGVLNEGDSQLEPAVRERLAAARKTALAQYREERTPAWVPAVAGWGGIRDPGEARSGLRLLLVGAALLVAVAFGLTWHNHSQTDIAEIDAGLLTDDLPINAYLDRGFDSWLKRVSR